MNYFDEEARKKNREVLSRISKAGVPYRVAYPQPETVEAEVSIGKSHAYKSTKRLRELGIIDRDGKPTELGNQVTALTKYVLEESSRKRDVSILKAGGPREIKQESREVPESELVERFGRDAVEAAMKSGLIGLSESRYFQPMDRESARETEIVQRDRFFVYLLLQSIQGRLSSEGKLIVPSSVLTKDSASLRWYEECGKSFNEDEVRTELMERGCILSALLHPMFRFGHVKGTVESIVMDDDELLEKLRKTPLKLY